MTWHKFFFKETVFFVFSYNKGKTIFRFNIVRCKLHSGFKLDALSLRIRCIQFEPFVQGIFQKWSSLESNFHLSYKAPRLISKF